MRDREAICEMVLLAALIGAIGVCAHVGCKPARPLSSAPPPAPQPVSPTVVVAERNTRLPAFSAVVAPAMSMTIVSNAPLSVSASQPYTNRGRLSLGWSRSPNPGIVGYRIFYGLASNTYSNSAVIGNVTNATLVGLEEGIQYYVRVLGFLADGTESDTSNEASAITDFYVAIREGSWAIETYGRHMATNQLMKSTNLIQWSVVKEFIGGLDVLNTTIETNGQKAFYRVRVKP